METTNYRPVTRRKSAVSPRTITSNLVGLNFFIRIPPSKTTVFCKARPPAEPGAPVGRRAVFPKAFPLWGEGVTAHAVTDEGSSFPCPSRGMAKGVPPCGAGPFPSDGKGTKGSPGDTPGGTTAPRAFRLGPTVRFPPASQAREPPSGVV